MVKRLFVILALTATFAMAQNRPTLPSELSLRQALDIALVRHTSDSLGRRQQFASQRPAREGVGQTRRNCYQSRNTRIRAGGNVARRAPGVGHDGQSGLR